MSFIENTDQSQELTAALLLEASGDLTANTDFSLGSYGPIILAWVDRQMVLLTLTNELFAQCVQLKLWD